MTAKLINSIFSVKMFNIPFTKLEAQGNYKWWKTLGYDYLCQVAYHLVLARNYT
jgi:hypothetical protein